ncbi:hypothetical protein B0H11DRAFT_1937875 [Mycena galericulata]|nr:hypothetical protein B0H11DRAFT_1937875 [Mycena galericulata]
MASTKDSTKASASTIPGTATAPSQVITLYFQDIVRITGETLVGYVDLNVALAQEEHIEQLSIKLRGSLTTTITTSKTVSLTEVVPINPFRSKGPRSLSQDLILFHTLFNSSYRRTCPHPSTALKVRVDQSPIPYRSLLWLSSPTFRAQMLVKESLRQGWTGNWKDIKVEEKLRRQGILGDYSDARPPRYHRDQSTPRSDRPEDKHGKMLFPEPPTRPSQLSPVLVRQASVPVRGRSRLVTDIFDLQGIRGSSQEQVVQATVDDPEWIPKDDKDRGIWRCAVHFNSTLMFPFAPTSNTQNLDWQYALQFVVPFPGFGNDLKIRTPLHLGAASPFPPPPIGAAGTSSLSYADIPPAGPPPMLDSPPSYWAGEDHDWGDEKN